MVLRVVGKLDFIANVCSEGIRAEDQASFTHVYVVNRRVLELGGDQRQQGKKIEMHDW